MTDNTASFEAYLMSMARDAVLKAGVSADRVATEAENLRVTLRDAAEASTNVGIKRADVLAECRRFCQTHGRLLSMAYRARAA